MTILSKRKSRRRMTAGHPARGIGPNYSKHIILTNNDSTATGIAENCVVYPIVRLDTRLSALRQTDEGETQRLKRVTLKCVFTSDKIFASVPYLFETKEGGNCLETKGLDINMNELIQGSANKAYEVKPAPSRFSTKSEDGDWCTTFVWNITKPAKRWFVHNATGFAAPADSSDLYFCVYHVGDASHTIAVRWFLDIEYYVVEGSVELQSLG